MGAELALRTNSTALRHADDLGVLTLPKRWPRCGAMKTRGDFFRNARAKDGRYAYCRVCATAKSKDWKQRNEDLVKAWHKSNQPRKNAQRRERIARNGGRHAETLRTKHGMTLGDYTRLLAAQAGMCAICGSMPSGVFHVDHDHATGRIRGLLCGDCNKGLGLFRDDAFRLNAAQRYLARPPADVVFTDG